MIRFDDLDSFVSPSVQGISQLEQLIDDESLNKDHLIFSGSKDFKFISLFQSEVTHLKSIVSKVHYADFKKSDCVKSLRIIIELSKRCYGVDPSDLAMQIIDSFVSLNSFV